MSNTNRRRRTKQLAVIAELSLMHAINQSKVKVNPRKYLDEAYAELHNMQLCLLKVEEALSPDYVVEVADSNNIRPTDINGEALIRCNKALGVLNQYLYHDHHHESLGARPLILAIELNHIERSKLKEVLESATDCGPWHSRYDSPDLMILRDKITAALSRLESIE